MTRIWRFGGEFATSLRLALPDADGTEPISVTHYVRNDEIKKTNLAVAGLYKLNHPSPSAELVLNRQDFDVDYFQWGFARFVSARMRKAMGLKRSTARFYEIDDSQSAPVPRSMNYRMMDPVASEDVSDLERSVYKMYEFMPGMPLVPNLTKIAFRADASPKRELFFDRFFATDLFCTDALAVRILKAGCTGLEFRDGSADKYLIRTLRGVELVLRHEETGERMTELVEAIDPDDSAT
jgi:hypothetical protein